MRTESFSRRICAPSPARLSSAPASTRHQDERLVCAQVFRGADQVEASAVGKLLIDKVDVVVVGLDPLETRDGGDDDLDGSVEVRVHERHFDQRLRLRVVVDQQDADMTKIRRTGAKYVYEILGLP